MHARWVRVGLILATGAAGAYLLAQGRAGPGIALLVGCAFLVWGYFRYGTVWLAFRRLRAGDGGGAARLLAQVHDPALLSSQQRAYYEWIRGALAAESGDLPAAESGLRESLRHNLRTSNDRSLVEALLAGVLVERGDITGAGELIETARGRRHKAGVGAMLDALERTIDAGGDGSVDSESHGGSWRRTCGGKTGSK